MSIKPKKVFRALRAAARRSMHKTVPQSVADNRMRICSGCPHATEPRTVAQVAAVTLSGGEFCCDICDCGISLIAVTKDDLLSHDSPEESAKRPDFCWHPRTTSE